MPSTATQPAQLARLGFWVLLAWVLATAVQLQQARLFSGWVYGAMLMLGVLFAGLAVKGKSSRSATDFSLIFCAALLAFASTGLRAHRFLDRSLDPALQGQDISVTGVVAAMVQRNETGLRFRMDVESARLGKTEVRLPPKIYLSWYGQAPDGAGFEAALRPMDLQDRKSVV